MDTNGLGKLGADLALDRPMLRKRASIVEPPPPPQEKPRCVIALKENISFEGNFFMSDNAIETELSRMLTPAEYMIYRQLWFASFGGQGGSRPRRNFCQMGAEDFARSTSIRSKTSIRNALQGLMEKGCIVRLEISQRGSTYRVLRPEEILTSTLEEGIPLGDLEGCDVIGQRMTQNGNPKQAHQPKRYTKNQHTSAETPPAPATPTPTNRQWATSRTAPPAPDSNTPDHRQTPMVEGFSLPKERESKNTKYQKEKGDWEGESGKDYDRGSVADKHEQALLLDKAREALQSGDDDAVSAALELVEALAIKQHDRQTEGRPGEAVSGGDEALREELRQELFAKQPRARFWPPATIERTLNRQLRKMSGDSR